MLPKPSPEGGGGGGEIELRPSAREAQPPGGTRPNLSKHHTRAHPHVGGRGGARGGKPPDRVAGQANPPTPIPLYTGTSYGHVPGVKVVSRCVHRSWAANLLKFFRSPCPYR